MHRAQLLLEEWQFENLRSLAERKGQSVSSVLREILDQFFAKEGAGAKTRLEDFCGTFDGPVESGRDHDQYLYGAPEKSGRKRVARR